MRSPDFAAAAAALGAEYLREQLTRLQRLTAPAPGTDAFAVRYSKAGLLADREDLRAGTRFFASANRKAGRGLAALDRGDLGRAFRLWREGEGFCTDAMTFALSAEGARGLKRLRTPARLRAEKGEATDAERKLALAAGHVRTGTVPSDEAFFAALKADNDLGAAFRGASVKVLRRAWRDGRDALGATTPPSGKG